MPSIINSKPLIALRKIYGILDASHKRRLFSVCILTLVGAAAEVIALAAVVPFITGLLSAPADDMRLLTEFSGIHEESVSIETAAVMFCLATFGAMLLRIWIAWENQRLIQVIGHRISTRIQTNVLNQSYLYYTLIDSSEQIAVIDKVQQLVLNVLVQGIGALTAIVIATAIFTVLVTISPGPALIAIIFIILSYMLIALIARKYLHTSSALVSRAYNDRVSVAQESLGAIRDIILDRSQDVYVNAFRDADMMFHKARLATAFIGTAPRFLIEALGMISIAIAAMIMLRHSGLAPALPLLGVLALGAQRLLPLVQQIYLGWTSIAASRSVIDDIVSLIDLPVRETPPEHSDAMTFTDEIRFKDVGFNYPGRSTAALEEINLVLRKGTRAALIGATGSGKSTMLDMLMGLLEPTIGEITVDGQAVKGHGCHAWQRNVAHVPQSIFLINSSIARNIAFLPELANMDRVVAAARRAQIHDFISSLPEGYDTQVGERGIRLSGGQRQRIGVARALYKEAPVLILDEATNALDVTTEAALIRAIQGEAELAQTLIIVSHRHSILRECDVVIKMEAGKIVQIGAYEDVVSEMGI